MQRSRIARKRTGNAMTLTVLGRRSTGVGPRKRCEYCASGARSHPAARRALSTLAPLPPRRAGPTCLRIGCGRSLKYRSADSGASRTGPTAVVIVENSAASCSDTVMSRPWLALVLLPLAGCAIQFHSQPGPTNPIEKTRVVAVSFDEAWSRSVSWFAANNVAIDKIENPSGLITANYSRPSCRGGGYGEAATEHGDEGLLHQVVGFRDTAAEHTQVAPDAVPKLVQARRYRHTRFGRCHNS